MSTVTKLIVDCATRTATVSPLTDAELAQQQTDGAAATVAAQTTVAVAKASLLHQRNRWLAQTDPYVLPAAALPSDMPAGVLTVVKTNQPALLVWRQQLRDWPATVTDWTAPPPMPTPPDIRLPSGRPLILVT